jgi:hypothetical protein
LQRITQSGFRQGRQCAQRRKRAAAFAAARQQGSEEEQKEQQGEQALFHEFYSLKNAFLLV